MNAPPDLRSLRWELLQHPDDPSHWQRLIDLVRMLGGGLLLADLDELFEEPVVTPDHEAAAKRHVVLQEGLEAHRAGDVDGVERALGQLEQLEPDGAWTHAIRGLRAEMGATCGYAAFTRALERDATNSWFRYWVSVAALRRRDWLGFTYQALLLHDSDTLEHQVLVLAAIYHLVVAILAALTPELCQLNDLRALDLVHPDSIAHSRDELTIHVQRYLDKERRKMLRVILACLDQQDGTSAGMLSTLRQLTELLHWRVIGLREPQVSMDLYAALQQRLQRLPELGHQPGHLQTLLPRRADLTFTDAHLEVWRDYRLILPPAP